MRSVLVLVALIIAIAIAACGTSGLSNNQFPCNVLSISGMCAVPSPAPVP
jgi:hypothetical protein